MSDLTKRGLSLLSALIVGGLVAAPLAYLVTTSDRGLNITDEEPDENIPGNSFGGIFPYNRRTTPFGFNGGFWYARATFSLDH